VTEPYLDDCVLDIATTGDASTTSAAAAAQSFETSGTGAPAGANLIDNPCLSVPGLSAGHDTFGTGSTQVAGWKVGGNSIDVVAATSVSSTDNGWQPALGCTQSVDLAGSAPGSVAQVVSTTPGRAYMLRWQMAGNPTAGGPTKTMHVYWDGKLVNSPSFDTSGHSLTSMGWASGQVRVRANSARSVVEFADASLPTSYSGATLDSVSLTAAEGPTAPATTVPQAAPKDISRPVVTDDQGHAPPIAGDVLLAAPGTWTGAPTGYTYQWADCRAGSCNAISGATAATYQLAVADVGDSVEVEVSAQNAIGTSAPASSTGTGKVKPGRAPVITSVTGLGPSQKDHVVVRGSGFGVQAAFNGNSPYIQLADVTRGWNAGNSGTLPTGKCAVSSDGDAVTMDVTSWTNTQVDIDGFTGSYGSGSWTYAKGDKVQVEVWNAQTSAGPACHSVTVRG
jgi:hypothetical protein